MDVTLVSTDVEGSTELWEWVCTLMCHACQMLVLRMLVLHLCYACMCYVRLCYTCVTNDCALPHISLPAAGSCGRQHDYWVVVT